jgi:branched-chain amino acid transport system permease protein
MSRRANGLLALLAPLLLVVAVAAVGSQLSAVRQLEFGDALVSVAIVVSIYVFVGNSGVLSFGHISFVAVGAYLSGILTLDVEQKNLVLPTLFGVLRHTTTSTPLSLVLAALAGGIFALIAGIPLMRLSGLPAGIATFAVLGITTNVISYWDKIGPGVTALALVPTNGIWTLMSGALITIAVAFAYQRSTLGRKLRATREDPRAAQASGIEVHRQRLYAFVLSGALAGFAGGLLVHELGSITVDQVSVELTFTTLAMLVVGGVSSLSGAVLGALLISGLNSFLADAEQGVNIGFQLTLPTGTRLVTIGAVMALVLILRPAGITGGREARLPRVLSGRFAGPSAREGIEAGDA